VAVAGLVVLVVYLVLLPIAGGAPQLATDAWGLFVLPKDDARAEAAGWPTGPASHDDLNARLTSLGFCPADPAQCGTAPDASDPFAGWSPDAVWAWAKDAWASAATEWTGPGRDLAQLARAARAQASVAPGALGEVTAVAADAVGHAGAVGLACLQRAVAAVPAVVGGVVEATRPAVEQLAEATKATSHAARRGGATGFAYLQHAAADTVAPAASRLLSSGADVVQRVRACVAACMHRGRPGPPMDRLTFARGVRAAALRRGPGMGRLGVRRCQEDRGHAVVGAHSLQLSCRYMRSLLVQYIQGREGRTSKEGSTQPT